MVRKNRGFTLIELMIVVAIIGILAAIVIPKFADLIVKAKEGATKGNLGALRSAVSISYGENEIYPVTLGDIVPKFIKEIPVASYPRTANCSVDSNGFTEGAAINGVIGGLDYFTSQGGGWAYSNVVTDNGNGHVCAGCTDPDTKGTAWYLH